MAITKKNKLWEEHSTLSGWSQNSKQSSGIGRAKSEWSEIKEYIPLLNIFFFCMVMFICISQLPQAENRGPNIWYFVCNGERKQLQQIFCDSQHCSGVVSYLYCCNTFTIIHLKVYHLCSGLPPLLPADNFNIL